jgi:uroporphyrinogen III methyltransferase / synthase
MNRKGRVYLVGAGPGDPGLLTLRAVEALAQAQVVIYDALIPQRILNLIPRNCEKIFRGRRSKAGALSQKVINDLLVRKALQGKIVVRLKGGDPFVFGRGAEEALALVEKGIPFEVVPGISSAIAVPAYAGIPVTHRAFNSMLTILTGHEDPAKAETSHNWRHLAQTEGTLVFLMGLHTLPGICERLLGEGKDPHTPVAVIQSGTTGAQRAVVGKLRGIVEEVKKKGLRAPCTVVMGKVVELMNPLSWMKYKALSGQKVLVTRSREQASFLTQLLEDQGAEVVEIPTIEIAALSLKAEGKRILKSLSSYDWLIFSSVNAVDILVSHLAVSKLDVRSLSGLKIACVGEATAMALKKYGLKADLVPKDYKQEGLAQAFGKMGQKLEGKRVLFARAKEGRDLLEVSLKKQKAQVTLWSLYETRVPKQAKQSLQNLFFKEGGVDWLVFASSSTVDHFCVAFTPAQRKKVLKDLSIAVVGPVTGESVKKWGGKVAVEAKPHTLPALVEAMVKRSKKNNIR